MADFHLEDEFRGSFRLDNWRKVTSPLRNHVGGLAGLVGGGVVIAAIEAYLPILVGAVIDEAMSGGRSTRLAWLLSTYVGLFAVFAAGVFLFIRSAGTVATGVGHDLRTACFGKLQDLPLAYFDTRPVGWLTSRITSDCARVSNMLPWVLLDFAWSSTIVTLVLIAMFRIDAALAWRTLTIVPVLVVLSVTFQRLMIRSSRQSRRLNSAMTASFNENLLGHRTTKSLAREEGNLAEFARLSGEMRTWTMRNALQSAVYVPMVAMIGAAGAGIALWSGAGRVLADDGLTLGKLITFLQFAALFAQPVQEVAQRFADLLNASGAAERLATLLDTVPSIRDGDGVRGRIASQSAAPVAGRAEDGGSATIGSLRFDRVSFGYRPDQPVLRDFDLEVRRGTTLALVGSTGGGKSTIVSLAARFYEPVAGRILVDGVDLRERGLHWFQSNLGVVAQVPHLFSGTVRENIRYGRLEATDADVEAAARKVNAHEAIAALEGGYGFEVGEGGERLSIGQRQLVALARAVLRDPAIFILDEATSSVDTATERLLQSGIDAALRDRISFVIAHRLSTIRRADRILVIEAGAIVEDGTHDQLIARRGRYHELYTRQFVAEREAEVLASRPPG
jgi:ATP-binding cassette subfamily B protein